MTAEGVKYWRQTDTTDVRTIEAIHDGKGARERLI